MKINKRACFKWNSLANARSGTHPYPHLPTHDRCLCTIGDIHIYVAASGKLEKHMTCKLCVCNSHGYVLMLSRKHVTTGKMLKEIYLLYNTCVHIRNAVYL